MSEYYIGEIRLFPYTYAPEDWLECNGQILQIRPYQMLFAIIGNQYGGSFPNTFALPNLHGYAPVGMGAAPGLSSYQLGKSQGAASVSITLNQTPSHQHTLSAKIGDSAKPPGQAMFVPDPAGSELGLYFSRPNSTTKYVISAAFSNIAPNNTALGGASMGPAGTTSVSAHENRQPFQAFRFCICVANGLFPPKP
jgi:microcystin-dependent protein